ncbi:restriction endonuclease subunit S [Vibrio cholerae]|uniref:restriction endonuclease subunit S n=1 Tax=Vibrio cholerae TaxID=666 RepID=UPI003F99EB1A|nr:restriction endonuclease subunit S [Vibrio cholerae]
MDKYQPYQVYVKTNHGVAKELPKGWVLSKLKYEVDYVEGPGILATDFHEVGVPLLRIQNVKDRYTSGDIKTYLDPQKVRDKWEHFKTKSGDLLISGSASTDLVTEVTEQYEGAVPYTGLIRMRAKKNRTDKNYLRYFLQSELFKNQIDNLKTGSTIQHFGPIHLQQIVYPSALVTEQAQIANFLDHETAKIDTLIAKQEKLIELLKEKRQAVLSHAVTKGLNPDAPMKDSGVEWLGEVPEHWAVLPTKRFFRLVAEPSPKNHDKELLSVYAAIGVAPRKELEQKGNKASNTDGYWLVKKGDIIVNKLLAWMGAVGYSEYNGVTSPAYDILRKTKDINPKFYHYLFRQEFTQKEFKRWSRGIMEMRLRLYFEELGRIMMPMPPKNEQDAIVDEIESMDSKFSQVEEKSKLQIELLKERKTALISAAVTGKIDVRDWEPK